MTEVSKQPVETKTSPTEFTHSEKEQQWNQKIMELKKIQDRRGMPIDENILEAVAALNLLGIHTVQSCEGHADWGTGAPYIDIKAPNTQILDRQEMEAFEKARQADEEFIAQHGRSAETPDYIEELFDKAHTLRKQAMLPAVELEEKAILLLDKFYQSRNPPYHQRLIIIPLGKSFRIESQGAPLQNIRESDAKQENLSHYQQEMQSFTVFLKDIFFGGSQSV